MDWKGNSTIPCSATASRLSTTTTSSLSLRMASAFSASWNRWTDKVFGGRAIRSGEKPWGQRRWRGAQGGSLHRAPRAAVHGILFVEEFGVVFCKHSAKRSGCALFHRVDFLNQTIDVSGHNQQITNGPRAGIPVGVRRCVWHENSRACAGFDYFRANANAQSTLQHVPRFIVIAMKMRRGDEAGRAWRTAGVAPLGDHKGIIARTDDTAG